MKNIKFVCNRTGYKKTFNINPFIFDRYVDSFTTDVFDSSDFFALIKIKLEIQKMSDKGFFQLVNKKYLDQFMLSEIGAK
jgi:hypothetical protein